MKQKNYQEDIVFNASEEAQVSKRRHTEQRIRDRLRETEVTSPRMMTINIPTVPPEAKQKHAVWPPQEIVIGNPEKPPKMIEVKGSFCPPREIVVIETKEEGRVPDVIQISDMIAAKKAAVIKSLSSTEMAVKGNPTEAKVQHMKAEQPVVVATLDKFQSRAVDPAGKRNATSTPPAPPATHHQQQQQQQLQKGMPLDSKDPAKLRRDLPSLGDEITVIKQSESSMSPLIPRRPTGVNNSQRHRSPDPPAAKASTTTRQILPDFSNLAGSGNNHKGRNPNSSGGRRKNILDESHSSNQLLHQSWPASGGGPPTNATPSKSQRTRTPQWLGVTGMAEDWIKPDDPKQIGLKIAAQRLER